MITINSMINYFKKMKLAVWLVVILTVINVTVIGTIVYHSMNQKFHHAPPPQEKGFKGPGKNFLARELKLNASQEVIYKGSREQFFKSSKAIFKQLETNRVSLIAEMSKAAPDTVLLYKYANEIGRLHASHKRLTINYFLGLKKILTPEQDQKLDSLYKKIIAPEMPMGPRHRDGWKRRDSSLKVR